MTTSGYKIWCNTHFSEYQMAEKELLQRGVGNHELRFFAASEKGATGSSREFLLEADIAFGQPSPETLREAQSLRWVHIASAGYAPYDDADLKENLKERGTILTNSSAVFDEPCAQHILAMMMSVLRALPYALQIQSGDKSWQMHALRPRLVIPENQISIIFGFGAIARRLIELLAPLKMNLIGVRREPKGDESIKIIRDREADQYLPRADHVINILPENPSTRNYFNRERFAKFKSTATFYNIGRGTTVDQNVLQEMLQTERLAGAYLDVTEPEPLPPDHPLWTTPNCFITPHIAGGSFDEKQRQINHFLENLRRFEQGENLINQIL